jgi:hypothetical protein
VRRYSPFVDDLAEVIVRLVMAERAIPGVLAVVGPRATSLAGYLADLRRGMQAAPALVLALPMPLAAWWPTLQRACRPAC